MKNFLKSENKKIIKKLAIVSAVIATIPAVGIGYFLSFIEGIDGGGGFTKFEINVRTIIFFLEGFLYIFIPGFIIIYFNNKFKEKRKNKNNSNIENN